VPQTPERAQALVAVDDDVTLALAHHHDRRLLPDVRQRREQPPLARRVARAQRLVAPIELVHLQLHRPDDADIRTLPITSFAAAPRSPPDS